MIWHIYIVLESCEYEALMTLKYLKNAYDSSCSTKAIFLYIWSEFKLASAELEHKVLIRLLKTNKCLSYRFVKMLNNIDTGNNWVS